MTKEKELTIEEKINDLAGYVMELSYNLQNLSNIFHLALLENGQALEASCSNCETKVLYPNIKGFLAFPQCPNSFEEGNEECKDGFSHIENPFDKEEE